ncbi:PspC domain-containing protein [Mucilaginibacter sp. UR6-11]|uniref:PspC domain-containing protein n=1 Tax=Mucilaginibacter sp. UR6-11 TaxID=1435644 RepID=UPI001E59FE21|nr:PspC domain-containing protein [Mucilaginibacter sp. UR6-11]MCC8424402.1 PspC domain-containing protein [Mucilaginibacter sp. UR6-11]
MNKTIIININGTVFHIEEDAYEILKNYMTDVKRHFLNSADSHEITTDIENRIAEMLSEILANENKQVIVEQDVRQVVELMGTVQDFENAEQDNDASAPHNGYVYNSGARILFRDPDDHLLGGVCAGLGNYFDIKPTWVRLLFLLTLVFFGTGFFLYIILWIVIPRAVTRADRMAMKGEKLNLQGFKNNFEEELSAVRNHLTDLKDEAKPMIYKLRDFISEFFYHLGRFFNGVGKVLVKVFGIVVLLACLGFAIVLIVCLAMVTLWPDSHNHMFPFSVMANQYANHIYFSGFVVAVIPLLAVFLITLKAIFNTGTIDKSMGSVIFVIWLFAVGVLVFYGSRVAAGFRSSASFNQTISLATPSKNTYYLKLNDVKYFTHDDSVRLNLQSDKNIVVTNSNDFEDYEQDNLSIRIEKSDVSKPVLVETFRAKGSHYEDALLNARNTKYIFVQQDSVLKFDRYLQRLPGNPWHSQEIEVTLKVPMNSIIVIEDRLSDFLRDGIDVYRCKEKNKKTEASSASFVMTDNGLECKVDTLVTTIPKPDSLKILKVK